MSEKKEAPKKEKKPTLDDLKLHLKGLKAQLESLPHTLKSELEKVEGNRGEESRLMSAARANAIKPHDEQKQAAYAKAQVAFNQAKEAAEAVYNEEVRKAQLELNEAIAYADSERKASQNVAREEFQKHADELFEEHKQEQEQITKKFDALAKALKEGVESSRKKIADEIEQLGKTIEALEKRAKPPKGADSKKEAPASA